MGRKPKTTKRNGPKSHSAFLEAWDRVAKTTATLTFACGARMTVKEMPSEKGLRQTGIELRNGMPPVRVASMGGETISVPHIGRRVPSCFWDCPCRKASGRREHRCFPDDYETKPQRYAGRSFESFAVKTISCYPVKIVRHRKAKAGA